jgi:hypothetical protein
MMPPIKPKPSYTSEIAAAEEFSQKEAEKAKRQGPCRAMRNGYFTTPLSEAAKERNKVLVENCINSLPMAKDFSDDDRGMICLTFRIERDGLIKIEKDKVEAEFRNAGDPLDKMFRLDDATRDLRHNFSSAEIGLDCRKRIGDG